MLHVHYKYHDVYDIHIYYVLIVSFQFHILFLLMKTIVFIYSRLLIIPVAELTIQENLINTSLAN